MSSQRTQILRQLILTLTVISFTVEAFSRKDLALPCSFILLLFVLSSASWDLLQVAVMSLLVSAAPLYFPKVLWSIPASNFSVPFLLSTLVIWPVGPARATLRWVSAGKIDRVSKIFIVLTGVFSSVALILWAIWSDNLGIGLSIMKGMSHTPKWIIAAGIPVFALVNAISEEVAYRGVLQEALQNVWGHRLGLVLVLQASAFAAAHYAVGFPNGKLGYLMTFGFAWMLGFLRSRSNGILAPYLAHIVADLVIGYFLFFKVF